MILCREWRKVTNSIAGIFFLIGGSERDGYQVKN